MGELTSIETAVPERNFQCKLLEKENNFWTVLLSTFLVLEIKVVQVQIEKSEKIVFNYRYQKEKNVELLIDEKDCTINHFYEDGGISDTPRTVNIKETKKAFEEAFSGRRILIAD
ncbi:hypothetical protein CRE_29087 [Caenorhabditis remanei]|uniref:Uncharacterized protein n=1 Tax=Caenorhabditis remanei TaxID=31234 RepID=E3MWB9_CAERE|nr:hypothetical protein CRE_29087 [Caenorhabditis remanei]